MTHVVTSACVKCKYQDCVAVCPVECFREADDYLVIDPDECIDCAACVPECPVEAIYADTDLPDEEFRCEIESEVMFHLLKVIHQCWLIPKLGRHKGS